MNAPLVLRTLAPAKVNLTLEVLGRRDDGYHTLAAIAQTLDLCDTITLEPTSAPAGERRVVFVDEQGRALPTPGGELVARAWALLGERYPGVGGGRVTVVKRIPEAAGLGGGSSDAAAFLRLARRAWPIAVDDAALTRLAGEIGSDLPLFLVGGCVRLSGRGDEAEAIGNGGVWSGLLYCPEMPLPAAKTRAMYGALRPSHFAAGVRTQALAQRLGRGEAPTSDDLSNTFDAVADDVLRGVRQARHAVAAAAGQVPLLCGAGPSLFVLAALDVVAAACGRLQAQGRGRAWVVRPLPRAAATEVETVDPASGA